MLLTKLLVFYDRLYLCLHLFSPPMDQYGPRGSLDLSLQSKGVGCRLFVHVLFDLPCNTYFHLGIELGPLAFYVERFVGPCNSLEHHTWVMCDLNSPTLDNWVKVSDINKSWVFTYQLKLLDHIRSQPLLCLQLFVSLMSGFIYNTIHPHKPWTMRSPFSDVAPKQNILIIIISFRLKNKCNLKCFQQIDFHHNNRNKLGRNY